jgi:hypothetical protein
MAAVVRRGVYNGEVDKTPAGLRAAGLEPRTDLTSSGHDGDRSPALPLSTD